MNVQSYDVVPADGVLEAKVYANDPVTLLLSNEFLIVPLIVAADNNCPYVIVVAESDPDISGVVLLIVTLTVPVCVL